LYFLLIFEVSIISFKYKQNGKSEKIAAQCWAGISPRGPTLLAWPEDKNSPGGPVGRHDTVRLACGLYAGGSQQLAGG
jgi:hypothetical protein